jgi:hypothetical protein
MKQIILSAVAVLGLVVTLGSTSLAVNRPAPAPLQTLPTTNLPNTVAVVNTAPMANSMCPINTTHISGTTTCKDAGNVYGAFSTLVINKCIKYSADSKPCTTPISMVAQNGKSYNYLRYGLSYYNGLNR